MHAMSRNEAKAARLWDAGWSIERMQAETDMPLSAIANASMWSDASEHRVHRAQMQAGSAVLLVALARAGYCRLRMPNRIEFAA